MTIKYFSFVSLLLFMTISAQAQYGFKGSLLFGFNAAQMDGDDLAGYNKVGLTGGLKVAYPIKEKMDLAMEMLYSPRGSQTKIGGGSGASFKKTSLNYFEMPVTVSFKDWLIEKEDYYKTAAHFGFSTAYLFGASSSDGLLTRENFKKIDLSLLLGLSYHVSEHWLFTVRYTTGLFKIYTDPFAEESILRSYFLTFRSEYQF